jgi:hypothetical protein
MKSNYIIVLFKNKVKKKIINKYQTIERVTKCYDELIDKSNSVIFDRSYENGVKSIYELAILQLSSNKSNKIILKDSLGRQFKAEVDDDDYLIMKILPYKFDESFLDFQTKKKINSNEFIRKYLSGDGLKMISKLNNKIIVQKDDNYNLFTFKTDDDSLRFIDNLSSNFISSKRSDCLFVKDSSTAQRKYLYELLVSQGFPKSYLFRQSTTFPKK